MLRRLTKMAWYCSGSTNTELIDNLSKAGLIENERVIEAMIGVRAVHQWRSGTNGQRLIEPTMPHQGHTRTHLSLLDMVLLSLHRTCMAMPASI